MVIIKKGVILEERSNLYRPHTTVSTMKCRRLQRAGQVARAVETRNANRIFLTRPLRKRSAG
jgi:hypothetical protein